MTLLPAHACAGSIFASKLACAGKKIRMCRSSDPARSKTCRITPPAHVFQDGGPYSKINAIFNMYILTRYMGVQWNNNILLSIDNFKCLLSHAI